MEISYGDLEEFLAEIHRVAPEKRTALKGRLKHFQRLGWPAGTNKGKGARVQYGVGQTLSLAVAMELLQIGLTPERIVNQLKYAGRFLPNGFIDAFSEHGPEPDNVYYVFSPESLSVLRGIDPLEEGFQSLLVSESRFHEISKIGGIFRLRRFAVINLSALLAQYIDFFSDNGLQSLDSLRSALENWLETAKAAHDKWQAKIIAGINGNGDT